MKETIPPIDWRDHRHPQAIWSGLAAACLALVSWSPRAAAAVPEKINFNEHIRPILADNCFACHGFDVKTRKAGLRLDTYEGATADIKGHKAIVPGKPEESEVWKRLLSDDPDEVMPPPEANKTLTPEQKELLKKWIAQGAPYQKHWSFEPPLKSALPEQKAIPQAQPGQAIDAFIGAKLDAMGLKARPEADRETLVRRVSFTATGLPPTLAEVEAFVADKSPQAYEAMVDHFLAKFEYGEEMGRNWLDVARYADTHGLHLDNERQMWAYRDWVVKAFNENLPFDKFSLWQLAGDLLPNPTIDQQIATGFNRCNVTTSEGGAIDAEWVYRYAVDRTSTMVQAWMGLTGGCATCHDHKFDPLSTKEFYSMYAFFHSASDPAMDGNTLLTRPTIKLNRPEDTQKLGALDAKIAAKQKEMEEAAAQLAYSDPALLDPKPSSQELETVWIDDEFPEGAKVHTSGHDLKWRTMEQGAKVLSGTRSLKRNQAGLTQQYYSEGAAPLLIPPQAELFCYVYLEPTDLSKAVMLQFHVNGEWRYRAMWGDGDSIDWGQKDTPSRFVAGGLPEAGKWVRLSVPAEKLNLKPGDLVTGLAMTQLDGTVYWDKFGVNGLFDPSTDPTRSFVAWWKGLKPENIKKLPSHLHAQAKLKPESAPAAEAIKDLKGYYLGNVCTETKPKLNSFSTQLEALRKERQDTDAAIPSTFVFSEMAKPRDSFVMIRGQYDKPGEKVEPGTPAILPELKKSGPRANRVDLVNWLFAADHPLTARVTVNRFWQQVFGTGLVKSSGDFGSQGQLPSHPELLDWLAIDFRESGWDMKRLMKLMMTSATFRQSSDVSPEVLKIDPENRFYARGPRLRLQAEQVRDNALFVAGLLSKERGGKGVNTYQPPNIWEPVGYSDSNTRFYKRDNGEALYRRSLYTFLKRTAPPPFMANFDAPNREQSCLARERSNTPMQALQLMNDVQHVEAARSLAQRMMNEGGADPGKRIELGFRLVLSRKPSLEEQKILQEQLLAHLQRYHSDTNAAKNLSTQGDSKPTKHLVSESLAAYTLVASTILNLDETINRN